jgi:DNA-binding beta-propeller fold protein YncE
MDYDPVYDEIVVGNPQAGAVLVFRGGANGNEAPIRVIQGPKTKLIFPHAVSVDGKNGEIIVGDLGSRSVLVFARNANGDVSPLREITPNGYLIVGTAVDPERNLLVVACRLQNRRGALLVYNRTDTGKATPRGIIHGPKTGIVAPWQVETHGGKIFVGVSNATYQALYEGTSRRAGVRDDTEILSPWRSDLLGFMGVWDINDHGDVPPRAFIKGPVTGLVHSGGVALNAQHGEIYVADTVHNGVFTFYVPEFFKELK